MNSWVRTLTVTWERWLWAPYSEIFFEQGHRLVTGTTTLMIHGRLAVADFADEGHFVIHQALHAGNRRLLVDEIGKGHLDVSGFGLQPLRHLRSMSLKDSTEISRSVAVENLHEARHVRALEIVRQMHVHVEHGDGVLHAPAAVAHLDRMADILDADLVDRQLAGVGASSARRGYGSPWTWPRNSSSHGFMQSSQRRTLTHLHSSSTPGTAPGGQVVSIAIHWIPSRR